MLTLIEFASISRGAVRRGEQAAKAAPDGVLGEGGATEGRALC